MYDNYIFDLYGTLADIRTNEGKASLWKHMARYMSLQGAPYAAAELRKRYRDLIGLVRTQQHCESLAQFPDADPAEIEIDLSRVISRLYSEKGIAAAQSVIADWALMFRAVSTDYEKLYEGAEEVLKKLHSLCRKVYLLSNAQHLFTEPELRSLGIYDLFDDVLISSDIGFMKPSRRFYGALLEKHRLDPKVSVMIGNDWKADAWGAHDNGLASMYIHTAQSPELAGELPPDCTRLNAIRDVLSTGR